ncbi:hypothetical protein Taro_050903 [Colocasia esculenta]|uniref:Uncharacterized protein n=1 Tax=Colocasia esculenta TaxID=4460 RepID=A0A843XFA5_COLES|nr:hypothetical protein [Colocasia esculenta]
MAVLPKACRNPCTSGAAAAVRERNPGAGPEISESGPGPTGSECRFGIGASRAVPITGRGNIHVLPKWCENWCTSTHAPRWHFGRPTRNFARLASSRPARRRVGIRTNREPLPPSGSGIRAPDWKSPSPA